MLVIRKEILKFKANNKDVNFSTQFYLGKVCIGKIAAAESTEVSFKGSVYDFSVNYNAISKSDIINIYNYSMVENSIKQMFWFIKQVLITLLSFSGSLATKCGSLNNIW